MYCILYSIIIFKWIIINKYSFKSIVLLSYKPIIHDYNFLYFKYNNLRAIPFNFDLHASIFSKNHQFNKVKIFLKVPKIRIKTYINLSLNEKLKI